MSDGKPQRQTPTAPDKRTRLVDAGENQQQQQQQQQQQLQLISG